MREHTPAQRREPRWPVALAIIAVLFILEVLSSRIRLLPNWLPYVIGTAQLLPMCGVRLSGAKAGWRRLERVVTLSFSVIVETAVLVALAYLIFRMLGRAESVTGLQLLTSSIVTWVMNVLAFSLAYWQIDRGGPEVRENDAGRKPDWLFPQEGVPDKAPDGWRPAYVDYLFLSFSASTAFSTTDTMPLTSRAKLLMMFESSVSLVTLLIVAARAINILNS